MVQDSPAERQLHLLLAQGLSDLQDTWRSNCSWTINQLWLLTDLEVPAKLGNVYLWWAIGSTPEKGLQVGMFHVKNSRFIVGGRLLVSSCIRFGISECSDLTLDCLHKGESGSLCQPALPLLEAHCCRTSVPVQDQI